MDEISIRKANDLEYCASCRKQGPNYINVTVGIMRLPFCDDCYEEFKKKVAAGVQSK